MINNASISVKVATKIEAYTEKGGPTRRKNIESWASYADIDQHKIVKKPSGLISSTSRSTRLQKILHEVESRCKGRVG